MNILVVEDEKNLADALVKIISDNADDDAGEHHRDVRLPVHELWNRYSDEHGDQAAHKREDLRLPRVHVQQDGKRRAYACAVRNAKDIGRNERVLEHALVRGAR